MDRYINMFINIVIRRLMTLGINKGIDAATKGRKKPEDKDLSAEQKKRLKDSANAQRCGFELASQDSAADYLKCFDSFSPWPW